MFKKIILIIIVLIAVIAGLLAIFIATFDANNYKDEITSLVKKQTGRDLNIAGDLKLAIYPDVGLAMGKTSLSNAAGFSANDFATIESGTVSVKLLPLLKKKIEADAILLDGLKLGLHRKADGSTNWDDLAKGDKSANSSIQTDKASKDNSEKEPAKVVEELMQNLSIAGVSLKNANIHWRDDAAKQDITVSPLNLKTGKFTPGTPLPIELDVTVKQQNPLLIVLSEGSTTVNLSNNNQNFDLSKLKLNTKVTGAQIPNGAFDAIISGDVKGSPQKINVKGLKLQSTLTGDLIPEGAVKTNITGDVDFDVNAQLLTITSMNLDNIVNGKTLAGSTANTNVTGDIKLDLSTQQLSIPNLLLNSKLDGGFVKGGSADANVNGKLQFDLAKQLLSINEMKLTATANGELLQGGKADTSFIGDILVDLANSNVKSPKVSLNSHVEGGFIPGGKLSQTSNGNLDLNWASNKGGVNLTDLLVKVAGLEVKGSNVKLQPLAEKPAIVGQFQTNTFNLKALLKTLKIEAPVTSNPEALTKVQAQFGLDANTDNAQLKGLKLTLDKSALNGDFAISNFASPAIRTNLAINNINLDDYLAPSTKQAASTSSSSASNNSGSGELLPLETLRGLDIDGSFKIGNMILNKLTMSNINAKINAKQGLININPANAQLYKGNYVGRITLDAKQTVPTMKMRHELAGIRSEGLLFDLFQDKYISGGAKMTTDLSSKGNTLEALLKNLNGTTSIGFNDGTIRDSNLAEKVSLAVKAFEKKEIKDGKSVVNFTGLSGDWKTTNGVFKTDNLSMLSPYFNINGSGTADVANEKLDMKLRIGPKSQDAKRPLFAPLRITGTFSDPKFSLDLKDLIKALAAQDLKKLELEAKAKIEQEKQALKLKFEKEKAKQQEKLKLKAEKAKADAIKKLKAKTGDKLGDKLINKLKGEKPTDGSEPAKSVEDQVKDKLKNKLKSLF